MNHEPTQPLPDCHVIRGYANALNAYYDSNSQLLRTSFALLGPEQQARANSEEHAGRTLYSDSPEDIATQEVLDTYMNVYQSARISVQAIVDRNDQIEQVMLAAMDDHAAFERRHGSCTEPYRPSLAHAVGDISFKGFLKYLFGRRSNEP